MPIPLSPWKKEKINFSRPYRSRTPFCTRSKSYKIKLLPFRKGVNTSKIFMSDQPATKDLKTLTPTRAARSVIGQGRDKERLF